MTKLLLIVAFVALSAFLVNTYPQLRFDERRESQDEETLPSTRRQSQLLGSFGHHNHQTYHPPSSGYGGLNSGSSSSGFGESSQSYGHGHKGGQGHTDNAIGPVFTFVRTDINSNFQWGVRHKVGGGTGWSSGIYRYPAIIRIRRGDHEGHHGHGYDYLGPVYTYVKTDYHGNWKSGVRHHVRSHGYGR